MPNLQRCCGVHLGGGGAVITRESIMNEDSPKAHHEEEEFIHNKLARRYQERDSFNNGLGNHCTMITTL